MSGETLERFLVALSDADRRDLLNEHRMLRSQWRDVWDEATGDVVGRDVPLPEPICGRCREPWGKDGCRTARAVVLLGLTEIALRERGRQIDELTEALTPRFGVEKLRDPGNRTIELRMQIDQHTLIQGRMPLVLATLRDMAHHFAQWFKDVGDLERVRADHLAALAMDSDRYVYLTQQFDPWVSAIKRPGAPWDEFAGSSGAGAAGGTSA